MASRYVVAIAAAAGAGIVAAVIAYGDIPYRIRDGVEIDIIATMVCLPHKDSSVGRRSKNVLSAFAEGTGITLPCTTMDKSKKRMRG